MSEKSALEKAIEKVGSQAAFAKLIGTSQQVVSYWVKKGKPLPAEHVSAIERETSIPRSELRPDLFDTVSSSEAA